MKTTVYLVRHAEVENPNHIIYGRLPRFDLSKRGLTQAYKLRDYFSDKNIAVVYASPLLRTRKTAKILSGGKFPIKYSRHFLEVNYKKWEGLRAQDRPNEELEAYIKNPDSLNLGETMKQLQKRVVRGIENAVKKYKGKEIVIVSHADPIIIARLYYQKRPLSELCVVVEKNASIASLTFDDELKCKQVEYKEIVFAKKESP